MLVIISGCSSGGDSSDSAELNDTIVEKTETDDGGETDVDQETDTGGRRDTGVAVNLALLSLKPEPEQRIKKIEVPVHGVEVIIFS